MQNQQSGVEHGKPRALGRFRGQAEQPRYRGVYHYHRQMGWHPHPHRYAARRLVEARPTKAGGARAGSAHTAPHHHHQHTVSARHQATARAASPLLEMGLVGTYDAASGTAMVQLLGSPTRLIGPMAVTACAPRDLAVAGALCLVVLLDAHNPQDGVVAALWPAAGSSLGAKLTQVGVAALSVAAASSASAAVPFPTAYAATPVVVATATDPAWAATVSGVTASGVTVAIRAAAPATGTVAVEWVACG